jgi:hypothetical protein
MPVAGKVTDWHLSTGCCRLAFRLPATQNPSWPLAATTHTLPTTMLEQ